MSALKPAQRGYLYQDVACAYFLTQSLVHGSGLLTLNRQDFERDRFDDLVTKDPNGYVRRQFKHSDDTTRCLVLEDFIGQRSRLRIDSLVESYLQTVAKDPADEYRLCATWAIPHEQTLLDALESTQAVPSFGGRPSIMYRLRADRIWPSGGAPLWQPLTTNSTDRADFIAFCERFIIELQCPSASRDFSAPGLLETTIISDLSQRIGIGTYPNQDRNPQDIAAGLVWMASEARTEERTLTPSDVERHLRLRADFGKVAQRYLIDKSAFHDRATWQDALCASALHDQCVIVEGPPGVGKSWSLERLAQSLKADTRNGTPTHLVAWHYCYLEPGDQNVQLRVTSARLFANLVAGLIESEPALHALHFPRYASGPRELEKLLEHAVAARPEGYVFLVVDGLDHIARVLADSPSLAREDTNVIEELASLSLPPRAKLILGSQPGPHLDSIRERATTLSVPAWNHDDLGSLAIRIGVIDALREVGLKDDEILAFLRFFAERSDGNPLYATLVCRGLVERMARREPIDPVGYLTEVSDLGNDVSAYYEHLLRTSDATGGYVAELLGLLDFSVSETEISEIFAIPAYRVKTALRHLSPVLKQVAAQGGVRIYHESFRRFIRERIQGAGGSIAQVMEPIITWLQNKPFFEDARAYRFLLPCLRRAGRNQEILELVQADFVTQSVAAGHALAAVSANFSLVADVAGEEQEWAVLARLAQLQRGASVCYDSELENTSYGEAFVSLFGGTTLSDRLLFDGCPTFSRAQGLLLCELCDKEGASPPWREYLSLPDDYGDNEDSSGRLAVAGFRGILRLEGPDSVLPRFVEWLRGAAKIDPSHICRVVRTFGDFTDAATLLRIARYRRLPAKVASLIAIEAAKMLRAAGNNEAAIKAATCAVKLSDSPELAAECATFGVSRRHFKRFVPTAPQFALPKSNAGDYSTDGKAMAEWVGTVSLAARLSPHLLAAPLASFQKPGWYWSWLRFVVAISQAEVLMSDNAAKAATMTIEAFRDLAKDTHPFRGEPRACDLYNLWPLIRNSVERGLQLLDESPDFEEGIALSIRISQETSSSLDNEDGGPLRPQSLIGILSTFADRPAYREIVTDRVRELLEQAERVGRYYGLHADYELDYARLLHVSGDVAASTDRWHRAARYLGAYGNHKEITLFDLLDSIPALAKCNDPAAKSSVLLSQLLTDVVVNHTDRRETKNAPNAWFRSLMHVDPAAALHLLARSMALRGGRLSWVLEDAFADALSALRDTASPLVIALLEAAEPLPGTRDSVGRRLGTIEHLIRSDQENAGRLIQLIEAQVEGDSHKPSSEALELLREFAGRFPTLCALQGNYGTSPPQHQQSKAADRSRYLENTAHPIFPQNATPLDVISALRNTQNHSADSSRKDDQLENSLGYRLIEMAQNGKEDEAVRTLKFYARQSMFSTSATPLAHLAKGIERHGFPHLASIAWTLAYTYSRGGRGWLLLGGEECHEWLEQGLRLSRSDALQTLSGEVARLVGGGRSEGIARHLTEISAAFLPDLAGDIWRAAFDVLSHRLPEPAPGYEHFYPLSTGGDKAQSTVDGELVHLIIARIGHPELRRKVGGLTGFTELVRREPGLVAAALPEAICLDTTLTTYTLILQVLAHAEQPPYPITDAIKPDLEALMRCGHFALQELAKFLLSPGWRPFSLRMRRPDAMEQHLEDNPGEDVGTKALQLDWGDRVPYVGEICPEFLKWVAWNFKQKWESGKETHQQRCRDRYDAFVYRHDRGIQPTPFLLWEDELFEGAFNDGLADISATMSRSGQWPSDANRQLLERTLPDIPLLTARTQCRIARPPLPLPTEQHSGATVVSTIGGDGPFRDWLRLAYIENQIIADEHYPHKVRRHGQVIAGAEAIPPQFAARANSSLPVGDGSSNEWFIEERGRIDFNSQPFAGPLCGLYISDDLLGKHSLLSLAAPLISICRLHSSPWPGPLLRLDSRGFPAVAFRWWSLHPFGDQLNKESPRIEGCELIVRPDIFLEISRKCVVSPTYRVIIINRIDPD